MHSNSGVDQYSPRDSQRADPGSHSVPEAPSSATATATATPTSGQSHAAINDSEGMPHASIATMGPSVPNPNETSPPVPDAQMISALEMHLSEGRSVSKKNRPKGKLDLIEDDDEPPMVFAADSVSSARKKEVMSYAASRPNHGAHRASLDPPGTTMEDQEQLRLRSPQISMLHNNNDTNPEEEEPSISMLPLEESVQESVQLRVRSPQTSMLSNNNDPPGASSSVPMFHVPEARLVVEDEESATPIQIHEATIVRTNSEQQADLHWWRRNQRNLVIGMLGVLCVIVAVIATLLASKGKNDSEGGSTNNSNLGGEESTANQTGVFDSNGPSETVTDPSTNEPPASIPNGLPSVKPTNTLVVMPIPSTNPNNITLTSQAKLVPDDGEASYFGFAVAVSGDTVVVGAYKNDENGSNSGAAYVFHHDGENFIQQAKLLPNDGDAYDEFGYAVAVSADIAVIGVHKDDDMGCDSGSAYVFIRDGDAWIQQAKLIPNDGHAGDHFGHAVGVSGNTIVVGAPYDDDNGNDSGSAYVFTGEEGTWNQQAKLKPKDGEEIDYFGKSLAVSGDTVVIGAEKDNDNGIDSGSAYVFMRDGDAWYQQSKLLPDDGSSHDNFGFAVAVNGDTIVVGAYGDDDLGSLSGSAYVFIDNGDTWSQQAKLLPSHGQAGDNFGNAVAVSEDSVIIGAKDSGAAYVYIRDGEMWKEQVNLLPDDGEVYNNFGMAVAASGNVAVIGAHMVIGTGNDGGSVHVFPLYPTGPFGPHNPLEGLNDPPKNELNPSRLPTAKPANTPLAVDPIPPAKPNLMIGSQAKLLPNDWVASEFGWAVSVSFDTVVIGAYKDNGNGSNSGSAYVYHHDGDIWSQQAKLFPYDGDANDEFGHSVAVSGDIAVVGAHKDDDMGSDSGSAYVYTYDGDNWSLHSKLLPNDGQAGDHFGHVVAVSGDTMVIGAPYCDDNGNDSGSAYVFIRDGEKWIQEAKLLPNDGRTGNYFGKALAVSGDTVVIGAENDDENGIDSGSAYVFIRVDGGVWHQQSKLLPNDGYGYDNFGFAVGVSSNTVVIGAFGDDDMGSRSGSAYVFDYNGNAWKQTKLLPTDGEAYGHFGYAVAVSGDTIVIGAEGDNGIHSENGAAYVYIRDGGMWNEQAKLLSNDGEDYDFGLAIALSEGNVVIGAHRDGDNGNDSGSAYVFPLQ